ncbi:MAG: lipid-A-disaccharide synthase [Planctomycetaceae bacterium]
MTGRKAGHAPSAVRPRWCDHPPGEAKHGSFLTLGERFFYLPGMTKNIFLSVGEPSGDQHAARLIQSLRRQRNDLQFSGFGGQSMRAAGCQLEHDLTKMAVVGLVEVLPKLREFFRLADQAEAMFKSGNVDGVLLVDFPGFNWHIAKRAKRYGIPVLYYLPPQLWAWGGWRIKKMQRHVDHLLTVLPFEDQWFREHAMQTTYVGHPFFDAVEAKSLDQRLLDRFDDLNCSGERLIAVLPGSRDHEVHRNFPLMLEAIRRLARKHRDARFLIAAFRDSHGLWCRQQLSHEDRRLPIDIFVGKTSEVIDASECAMMVSGSVSLELLARGTPAAVLYRVGRVLHSYAKMVVHVNSITLVNLMAGKTLFPEMVSVGRAEPAIEFLHQSVAAMLRDDYYRQGLRKEMNELCAVQAVPGATDRAADALLHQLGWAASPGRSAHHASVAAPPLRRVA